MNTAESRLAKTLFIVEATSFEQYCLWENNASNSIYCRYKNSLKWEQMDGWLVTVGEYRKRQCCISVSWARINNKLVMFYYPTSRFVDWNMIDKWINKHFQGKWDKQTRKAKTDAQNFHLCIQAINEVDSE